MAERHANYRTSVPEDAGPAQGGRQASSAGFRFTIGGLLALTAAAAVIAASLFSFPPVVSALIASLISVCLPATLLGCAIYGGPAWRAFALGMLLPTVLRLFGLVPAASGGQGRNMMAMVYLQQTRAFGGSLPSAVGSFEYFAQLAEFWDRWGYAIMTDECIFWVLSAFAGLAMLKVQQRFVPAGAAGRPLSVREDR